MSLLSEILKILDEKKAVDITVIDTSKYNYRLSDQYIIASGTSSRHIQSVAEHIYKYMKSKKLYPKNEGNAKTGWILVEAEGIEVHLFKPDLRQYYSLEEILRADNIKK